MSGRPIAPLTHAEITALSAELDRGPRPRRRTSAAGVEYVTDVGGRRWLYRHEIGGKPIPNRAARRDRSTVALARTKRIPPVGEPTSATARMGRRARNRARVAGLHKLPNESVAVFERRTA